MYVCKGRGVSFAALRGFTRSMGKYFIVTLTVATGRLRLQLLYIYVVKYMYSVLCVPRARCGPFFDYI